MRFLCLPGAFGSIDKFKVQLAPLVKELESDKAASFHFIQGPYEVTPPEGYEEFFGGPPYYRFIVPSDSDADTTDVIERIRDFPQLETPEMTMRELMTYGVARTDESAQRTLEYLYDLMEKEGPFDGIMGYSEGATIAGTLLLHEQMREELEGREPMFKCALFFGGWPPMTPTLDGLVLSDDSDLMIEIPTTHIIGSLDPYLHGNLALYNVCDPDTAFIFDHAKGHTLPRDKIMVKELGDTVRRMIEEANGTQSPAFDFIAFPNFLQDPHAHVDDVIAATCGQAPIRKARAVLECLIKMRNASVQANITWVIPA